MMFCTNCEYPITRRELDARKCNNGGKDPGADVRPSEGDVKGASKVEAQTLAEREKGNGKDHGGL
jgi:hypothetical protein